MKKPSLRGLPALLVIALVIVVSGATGAVASGLVTSSQIKNHTIKTIDMSDAAISDLQGAQGPQGPEGPAGHDGAPGPVGPAGPSNTYATWHDGGISVSPGSSTDTTLLTLDLPAGSYLLQGKAVVTTAGTAAVNCDLFIPNVTADRASITVNGQEIVNLVAVGTTNAAATATLGCRGNAALSVNWNKLVATKVGSLSNNPS